MPRHTSILAPLLLLLCSLATASDEPSSVFLIGNSLTWDTIPARLDGPTQWHVDCGKSLPFIVANPQNPCVKTSTLWPDALRSSKYDLLSIQVHYGSTLQQDVTAISELIRLQPDAQIIIHTGWARSAERLAEWASVDHSDTAEMQHSPIWFEELLRRLKAAHPGRVIRRTRAMDLLHLAASDVATGTAPIEDIAELYRDKIHMNTLTGRYLMHNAMRHALGQNRSVSGFEKLPEESREWLDSVLDRGLQTPGVKSNNNP